MGVGVPRYLAGGHRNSELQLSPPLTNQAVNNNKNHNINCYDKKQIYIEYFCVMYNYYLPCIILTIANEIRYCYSHFINEESKVTYLVVGVSGTQPN